MFYFRENVCQYYSGNFRNFASKFSRKYQNDFSCKCEQEVVVLTLFIIFGPPIDVPQDCAEVHGRSNKLNIHLYCGHADTFNS